MKYILPVPDITPIAIQIPYYATVRMLCRYYHMIYWISFAMHNVEFV